MRASDAKAEGTARGRVQNNSDQRQYIDVYGKTVTDCLIITNGNKDWFDGNGTMVSGKWYYFYSGSSLATDTTIDGYEVGEDDARE